MRLSEGPSLRREALRAAGAAVGAFILANLAGEILRPPFDTMGDWISMPSAPLAGLLAVALLGNAFLRERPRLLRRAGVLLTGGVVAVALGDMVRFYIALARGRIHTPAVVPASALIAAFFAALLVDFARGAPPLPSSRRRNLVRLAAAGAMILALPVVRMVTFGPTRYERGADCAVVFGARVWNDGTPSNALADRVDESIRLYQAGRVRRLVMSGGIDRRNGHSEPEVMRARAESAGVPREAILLDEEGVDTASTVRNVAGLLKKEGLASALVVTHYYHEPRAKMLFDRAGVRAFTVPATMRRRLLKEPYFIAREIAAFYHSFLRE
ncbi:SanA protein [Minicystis rosea]|nr:SanA protein [Minicystis rosea]